MAGVKGRSGGSRKGAGRKARDPFRKFMRENAIKRGDLVEEKPKPGRPPYEYTAERANVVKNGMAFGLTADQICQLLGISMPTLHKNFAKELETGLPLAILRVAQSLYENATRHNNVSAQIFFLKTRAKWKEAFSVEGVDGKDLFPEGVHGALADAIARIAARSNQAESNPLPAKRNGSAGHA
jgi:AraC-like DNA-binding protein